MLVGVADDYSIDTSNAKVFNRTILDYGVELPEGVSLNANKTALIIGEGAALESDTISVGDTLFAAYVPNLNEINASAY